MRSAFLALACIAFACHGRRVQHKEALKGDTSIDTEGVSPQIADERQRLTSSTHTPSDLLLAHKPASAINRMGATRHVARADASNMNGVVVSERGPELATEETTFKLNPYTEMLSRARVKNGHSPHHSISVPTDDFTLPPGDATIPRTDPLVVGMVNPKKMLRSKPSTTPEDALYSKSGWGRFVLVSITAALVAGIGLATRKKIASTEHDIDGDVPCEAEPPSVADVKMLAKDAWNPRDPFTITALQSATETRPAHVQDIFISDPVVVRRAEGKASIKEQDALLNSAYDQKEAADAKRKWMKMLRKNRRARRHRRLQHLKRMQKMRLQRLKAARLHMKRKMHADFGVANDPGLEKRISQQKHEDNTPPRRFYRKDPRKVLSQMMRLLRLLLRSMRMRRVRTTTKKTKKTKKRAYVTTCLRDGVGTYDK